MLKRTATYSDIDEAIAQGGCPICFVGSKLGRNYLELLLWGSVNDPSHRETLRQALGFCAAHSRVLLSFTGERLGVAIVQQALLKEAVRRLDQAGPPPGRSLSQWVRRTLGRPPAAATEAPLPAAGPCPVCQEEAKVELRGIEVLLDNLLGDLDDKLRQAGGLCWPHLDQALQLCHDPQAYRSLLAIHRANWQQLVDHLGEFIRKRDYRFSHEPVTDPEADAIGRAIASLTGEAAVITDH